MSQFFNRWDIIIYKINMFVPANHNIPMFIPHSAALFFFCVQAR